MSVRFGYLSDYKALRKLVKMGTKSASWWDIYWASELERLVRRTRFQHELNFKILFKKACFAKVPVLTWISLGYTVVLDAYLEKNLPVNTAGEFIASAAFIASLVDLLSDYCEFSYDFLLDLVSIALWQKIMSMQPKSSQCMLFQDEADQKS